MNAKATKQLQLAWDETISPYINSIDDGDLDVFDGLTKDALLETLYQNVVTCHFEPGLVHVGGLANRELRFHGKEVIMAEINRMWNENYDGEPEILEEYLSA
jgi:hypothetical protein